MFSGFSLMRLQIDGRAYRQVRLEESCSVLAGTMHRIYGARPALGVNDLKRTSMMRLFARRQDSRPSSEPRIGPARSADRPGRRARRRARPEAEALDSRC